MKELFKSLRDTLAAVQNIEWSDYDMGQLDDPKPPVSWPCALFSFDSGDYESISATNDTGTIAIEIVLGFLVRERTHSKAVEMYSDQALAHIDTVEEVRKALTGLTGSSFAALGYKGFTKDKRSDYRVWRLRFECEHYPEPPQTAYTTMTPQPGFCLHLDTE